MVSVSGQGTAAVITHFSMEILINMGRENPTIEKTILNFSTKPNIIFVSSKTEVAIVRFSRNCHVAA